jgi:hypothetical protein
MKKKSEKKKKMSLLEVVEDKTGALGVEVMTEDRKKEKEAIKKGKIFSWSEDTKIQAEINETSANTMDKYVLLVVKHMKKIKDPDNFVKLVFFLCICAANDDYAKIYERGLPLESIISEVYRDGYNPIDILGMVGCAILSMESSKMSKAMLTFKRYWTETNGGYTSIFTARTIVRLGGDSPVTLRLVRASKAMKEEHMEMLCQAISSNCEGLRFSHHSPWYVAMQKIILWVSAAYMRFVPKSLLTPVVEATFSLYNKVLLYTPFMAVGYAISAWKWSKKDEGYIIGVIRLTFTTLDRVGVFLAGTRLNYIMLLVILGGFEITVMYILEVITKAAAGSRKDISKYAEKVINDLKMGKAITPGDSTDKDVDGGSASAAEDDVQLKSVPSTIDSKKGASISGWKNAHASVKHKRSGKNEDSSDKTSKSWG